MAVSSMSPSGPILWDLEFEQVSISPTGSPPKRTINTFGIDKYGYVDPSPIEKEEKEEEGVQVIELFMDLMLSIYEETLDRDIVRKITKISSADLSFYAGTKFECKLAWSFVWSIVLNNIVISGDSKLHEFIKNFDNSIYIPSHTE